ncbi:MAG: CBS domain-containing protein, partial [Deltaproteobacteria bacterium]
TLFIFGGVARLTKEPQDAATELKIALAGPAASVILAGVFYLLSGAVGKEQYPAVYAVVYYLAFINLALFVFNMIPGFPLDGGRVFRALWWARTGDLNTATKVASGIGKGFAAFLIVFGLVQMFTGNLTGGIWYVLIGVFVRQAAESGYQQLLIKRALEKVKVKDIMSKNVVTIDGGRTLAEAVEEYFFKYHFVSFPVTSDGRVIGLLTLGNIRAVEKQAWGSTLVKDAMRRLGGADFLSPDDNAIDALNRMSGSDAGRLTVLEDGVLAGIISRRDIMKLLEFKAGLGG